MMMQWNERWVPMKKSIDNCVTAASGISDQCTFVHLIIPGPLNVLADFFSRTPSTSPENNADDPLFAKPAAAESIDIFFVVDPTTVLQTETDAFLNLPANVTFYPLDYEHHRSASAQQQQQQSLLLLLQQQPTLYTYRLFGNYQLICYQRLNNTNWKIVLADAVLENVILWYHHVLNHAGMTNLLTTLSLVFYHSQLKSTVERLLKTCSVCQRYKTQGPGYGKLAPREALFAPWYEIAIDTVGPWTITIPNHDPVKFFAITVIDTVTNLTEIIRALNHSAVAAAHSLLASTLSLSRSVYP